MKVLLILFFDNRQKTFIMCLKKKLVIEDDYINIMYKTISTHRISVDYFVLFTNYYLNRSGMHCTIQQRIFKYKCNIRL